MTRGYRMREDQSNLLQQVKWKEMEGKIVVESLSCMEHILICAHTRHPLGERLVQKALLALFPSPHIIMVGLSQREHMTMSRDAAATTLLELIISLDCQMFLSWHQRRLVRLLISVVGVSALQHKIYYATSHPTRVQIPPRLSLVLASTVCSTSSCVALRATFRFRAALALPSH